MSTVAERKAAQWYKTKPNSCSTCRNKVVTVFHWSGNNRVPGPDKVWNTFHAGPRCGIGDFPVGEMATCDQWEAE